jgi:hypothetical protein
MTYSHFVEVSIYYKIIFNYIKNIVDYSSLIPCPIVLTKSLPSIE